MMATDIPQGAPAQLLEAPVHPHFRSNFSERMGEVYDGTFLAVTRSLIHRPGDPNRQVAAVLAPVDWWADRVSFTGYNHETLDWHTALQRIRSGEAVHVRDVDTGEAVSVDIKGMEAGRNTLTNTLNAAADRRRVHTVIRRWSDYRTVFIPPSVFEHWTGATVEELFTPAGE